MLQGFAALVGVVIVGIVFKLQAIENSINERIKEVYIHLSQGMGKSIYGHKQVVNNAFNRLITNKEEISEEDSNIRKKDLEKDSKRVKELLIHLRSLTEKRKLIREEITKPLICSLLIISISAIMLILKDLVLNEVVSCNLCISLTLTTIVLIFIALYFHANFVRRIFLEKHKSNVYDNMEDLFEEHIKELDL